MVASHKESINANLQEFTAEFGIWYDNLDATKALSLLFSKTLLEFNVESSRKSLEDSSIVLGNTDPNVEANGFTRENILPEVDDFKTTFPKSLFKPGVKVLDFACGTGIVTQHLAPYLRDDKKKSEIVGLDISEGLLQSFDVRAKEMNKYDGVNVTSCKADILDPDFEHDYDNKFDIIFSTIAYHHIENYRDATKKLVTFLRPGGWLLIVDFYNEDVESVSPERPVTASVRHMGGLKISALNETLGDYCGLEQVSSAREFRTYLWEPAPFIESHCPQEYIDKLHSNSLPFKTGSKGEKLYLIESSVILAIGQKKPT